MNTTVGFGDKYLDNHPKWVEMKLAVFIISTLDEEDQCK